MTAEGGGSLDGGCGRFLKNNRNRSLGQWWCLDESGFGFGWPLLNCLFFLPDLSLDIYFITVVVLSIKPSTCSSRVTNINIFKS